MSGTGFILTACSLHERSLFVEVVPLLAIDNCNVFCEKTDCIDAILNRMGLYTK